MKWLLFGFLCFFIGAISHEADIAKNCKDKGSSFSWFFEIKCLSEIK